MDESGIIYCATRKNVDKLYDELGSLGISVTKYHAGLDNETRKQNQDDFIYDRGSGRYSDQCIWNGNR